MRGKLLGIATTLALAFASKSYAQTATQTPTPTPTQTSVPTFTHTFGPSPTPTPEVAYMYRSEIKLINTVTPNNQQRPSVAVSTDNRALIAFQSDASATGFFDIKGLIFDDMGNALTGEFQINQPVANHIAFTPDAAAASKGNFLVVWALFNSTVTDSNVYMRPVGPNGLPLADAVLVNTSPTGMQRLPSTTIDPTTGDVYVAWESEGQDGNGYTVMVRKVDGNTWQFLTPEVQLNNQTAGNQDRVRIGADATGLTATWSDSVTGVEARRFDLNLNPVADQYNVFPPGFVSPDVWPGESPLHTSTRTDGVFGRVGPGDDLGSIFRIYAPPSGTLVLYGEVCRGDPGTGPSVTWEEFKVAVANYRTRFQSLEQTPTGLNELFGPFEVFPSSIHPWIPTCAQGGNQQFWWAGQNFGGANDEVYSRYGGLPVSVQMVLDQYPYSVVAEGVELDTYFANRNGYGYDLDLSGNLESGSPLRAPGATNSVTINDATADYGIVPPGGLTDCRTTGDCYTLTIHGPRPALDWDEHVTETLNTGVSKTWLIHVGESFPDVPLSNPFIFFIENLLHNGITAGGACGGYCPTDGVKRQQMAVFLLKSRFGSAFVPPPATGTIFTDVTLANPFASWIEALFLLGITGGCSGGPPPAPTQFCPDAIVNRQQMAVFLLKTLEGPAYVPPAATGIFQDVLDTNPFRPWIEELYNRQVTGGCVLVPLQYCPGNPTNRQQMAAFLTKTFGLTLYGP